MAWILLVLAASSLLVLGASLGRLGGRTPEVSSTERARQLDEDLADLAEKVRLATQHDRDLSALIREGEVLCARYPDQAEAYTLLSQMQMQAGRGRDALATMDRSLTLQPHQPEVLRFAGSLAEKIGEPARAEAYFQAGVTLDSQNVQARLALANLQLKAGKLRESEQHARQVLQLNSAVHQAHLLLADIAVEAGDLTAAHDHVIQALTQLGDQSPREREVYTLRRARILRHQQRLQDAVAVLRALPVEQRYGPRVSRELADLYAALGHPELAALHYEQILAMDPTHADAAAEAARWYRLADRPQEAARMLVELRRLNPRHAALER